MESGTKRGRDRAMFNTGDDRVRLHVTLSMDDGRTLQGRLLANMGGTLERTLNNEAKFVSFEDDDSEWMIAKKNIVEVVPGKHVEAKSKSPMDVTPEKDPFKVLELDPSASDEEIAKAFLQKAEIYRTDRIDLTTLPSEVSDYMQTRYRQIYEAHSKLMEGKTQAIGMTQAVA